VTTPAKSITAADDYFHERNDDPYWNESGWFGFNVPERDLAGCVYVHQRPNRGYAWAGLILWDRSGQEIYDCLWHDYNPQHLPASSQLPSVTRMDIGLPEYMAATASAEPAGDGSGSHCAMNTNDTALPTPARSMAQTDARWEVRVNLMVSPARRWSRTRRTSMSPASNASASSEPR
jgi:hypothetical protein